MMDEFTYRGIPISQLTEAQAKEALVKALTLLKQYHSPDWVDVAGREIAMRANGPQPCYTFPTVECFGVMTEEQARSAALKEVKRGDDSWAKFATWNLE